MRIEFEDHEALVRACETTERILSAWFIKAPGALWMGHPTRWRAWHSNVLLLTTHVEVSTIHDGRFCFDVFPTTVENPGAEVRRIVMEHAKVLGKRLEPQERAE